MLFGDKKSFGIEVELEDNKEFAHILLYISNTYIGDKNDITYVKSFFASLELRLLDLLKPLPSRFLKFETKEVAKILFHDKYFTTLEVSDINNIDYDLLDELRISNLEDTFDSFNIMAYRKSKDNIVFCWEIDLEYHSDKNYPLGIHCKELKYSYVKNVIEECMAYIEESDNKSS